VTHLERLVAIAPQTDATHVVLRGEHVFLVDRDGWPVDAGDLLPKILLDRPVRLDAPHDDGDCVVPIFLPPSRYVPGGSYR
jgi:hypothetical protein